MPRKIKIMHITGTGELSGANRYLLTLIRGLDKKLFSQFLICPTGPMAGKAEVYNADTMQVDMPSWFNLHAIRQIKKCIKHRRPDIINMHTINGGICGRVAAWGLKIPIVYTEHYLTCEFHLESIWQDIFMHWMMRRLDKRTNKTICVSQAVQKTLLKYRITKKEKTEYIYGGLWTNEWEPVRSDERGIIVGVIASLYYYKGVEYFIRAIPRVLKKRHGVRFLVVGEGPLRGNLEKLAQDLRVEEDVIFTGNYPTLQEILNTFDILVIPSLTEAFGFGAIEAGALEVPVIATDTGGLPEVIKDGKNGILVPPCNPKAIADAILKFLYNFKESIDMGKKGRKTVEYSFTAEETVGRTERLYQAVLSDADEQTKGL